MKPLCHGTHDATVRQYPQFYIYDVTMSLYLWKCHSNYNATIPMMRGAMVSMISMKLR